MVNQSLRFNKSVCRNRNIGSENQRKRTVDCLYQTKKDNISMHVLTRPTPHRHRVSVDIRLWLLRLCHTTDTLAKIRGKLIISHTGCLFVVFLAIDLRGLP